MDLINLLLVILAPVPRNVSRFKYTVDNCLMSSTCLYISKLLHWCSFKVTLREEYHLLFDKYELEIYNFSRAWALWIQQVKDGASITNKLFIRFTDKSLGHSSRLYFSAKPQIGHSVRRSYLDECHSSDFLDLKQSLDIYVIIFCANYYEF